MSVMHVNLSLKRADFSLSVTTDFALSGVTAIWGASGSGKTTLLRCLAGLEKDANGVVQIGEDSESSEQNLNHSRKNESTEIWQDSSRHIFVPTHLRAVGYVFQEASLFEHLSVRGNLNYALVRSRQRYSQASSLEPAIELLGIGHLLDRSPLSLSGGERQRVAIARALATQPRMLMMDEPLASLDAQRKQEIMPWLERLRQELTLPIFYVTHSLEEVLTLSDQLLILSQGQIQAKGAMIETIQQADGLGVCSDPIFGVMDGVIQGLDTTWHLALIQFSGVDLWVKDQGFKVGQAVRLRINANDVSLTLQCAKDTSIQNHVPVQIVSLHSDTHPSQVLVTLRAGIAESVQWQARITARSVHEMSLMPGMQVWAQIKSVALIK